MADIFISYARDDRPRAETLAHILEGQGWSVWWDVVIPAGRTFDEVIDEALETVKCVIVLWSSASVDSRYVRGEAQDADERGILVPVLIEKDIRIPRAFRAIHAADLVGWDGSETARSFQRLVDDIARLLGPPPILKREEQRKQAEAQAKREAEEEERVREAEIEAQRQAAEERRRQAAAREQREAEEERRRRQANAGAKRLDEDPPDAGWREREAATTRSEPVLFNAENLYQILQRRVGTGVAPKGLILAALALSVVGTYMFLAWNFAAAGRPELIVQVPSYHLMLIPHNFVFTGAAIHIAVYFLKAMREPTSIGRLSQILLADVVLAPILWFLAVAVLYPFSGAESIGDYMQYVQLKPDDDSIVAWACLTPTLPILAHAGFTAVLLPAKLSTR